MATYQTRRRVRLTPLGWLVCGALALLVVIGLVLAAKAASDRWFGAPAGPGGGTEAGTEAASEPQAEAGDHPDAAIVVTYQVAAAGPVEVGLAEFAGEAQAIFNDPSGWLSAGVGFDRVAEGGDFTLWLATPDQMSGFNPDCSPDYSCRVGPDVIINQERWLRGALPGALDSISLGEYRTMAVNHEVGHWLGHDHSTCPGPDQPAPLMMQQSKGLDGCLPNIYPLPEERTAPALGLG
ncbi:MAG: DUF3152 domain-containing protein [Bifidobacteriaceae bacterium]|jgi:hypothetical protein|nr:DUF3152 domain-containing protein [Bifidobacteriaceae bacterium]